MTEPTTADILAAWQLIEEHGLGVCSSINGFMIPCGDASILTGGDTLVAAVRAWSKWAGVPWPAVKVVPMWALMSPDGLHSINEPAINVSLPGWDNVPCDVVIRESEGV